jgi:hypothetical protein
MARSIIAVPYAIGLVEDMLELDRGRWIELKGLAEYVVGRTTARRGACRVTRSAARVGTPLDEARTRAGSQP